MVELDSINRDTSPIDNKVSFESLSFRDAFFEWLSAGNTKKYPAEVILSCIDRISEYATIKKISTGNLWEYKKYGAFKPIYNRLLEAKLLRITDRNAHKVFIVAGQLYMRFLKEKPFIRKAAITAVTDETLVKSAFVPEKTSKIAINLENVISWLTTQPNVNGTLYLENVVRKYMSALRTAPAKLEIPAGVDVRNVFACHTPDELNAYWNIFKAAPNYKQVNNITSGMFSAGMGCYLKYLQHLENVAISTEKVEELKEQQKVQLSISEADISTSALRADFSRPELCAQSRSLTCAIKGQVDPVVVEKLTDVLSMHFSNGYRLNSPIEMARFRSFALEDLGEELSLTDEELKNYIMECGTTLEGKVYAVSAQSEERIKELTEEYFADGSQAIFFTEFYSKNQNWLFEASVVSEDLLITILRRVFPSLSFTQTYFGYIDVAVFIVIESEILRVWGDEMLQTYKQLAERLKYIPLERIKSTLGQNANFIWNSVETFSHISRIHITEEERESIIEATVHECNTRGYVSITDLPFMEIEERNYELSVTAIHNAVYSICLSDKFDKKGKIVTRKGDTFDAHTIMKEYCRTIDKCSLEDLLNFERELTGEVHRWIPMEAANAVLVRIDRDTYVEDKYVHFNVEVIDAVIELFVKGDYLPLKSFTTFGAFPHCGQEWNLFLLESYCRRFSQKFRFDTPSVNSRNAGAVIRKSCGMDYIEIMTDAVVGADIALDDTAVGKFLYESGYMGRSSTAKVSEIIKKAKAIQNRRD